MVAVYHVLTLDPDSFQKKPSFTNYSTPQSQHSTLKNTPKTPPKTQKLALKMSSAESSAKNGPDHVDEIMHALNSSQNDVSEDEKLYIKNYRDKELKARKHLKKSAYKTVLAVLFFKFFTFYESSFFLILRIILTYATFTFSEPARKAVEEAVYRSGAIERLVGSINETLRESGVAVGGAHLEPEHHNPDGRDHVTDTPYHVTDTPYHVTDTPYHVTDTPYHVLNAPYQELDTGDHELDDMDSLDFTASSEPQLERSGAARDTNLGDAELPGGFSTHDEAPSSPDQNTGTVTFTSNFGGINFRVETNADFGGVHDNIHSGDNEITAITPSMERKLKAASEDFLMKQFNKKFKFLIYADLVMIIFRLLFPLSYSDLSERRGYAFIDIFSDYKKYPNFFTHSTFCLNVFNLFFEAVILGLHITLYQVACLENPKIHKLKKKMILLQFRCKQLVKKEGSESDIARDRVLLRHCRPFSVVVIKAVEAVTRE